MEQITLADVRRTVYEELEKCGINVPVEFKFDYSCIQGAENSAKTKKFIQLCNGNWRNAIYVAKDGERNGDRSYFNLLYCPDEYGRPVCIPVPLARTLFGVERSEMIPAFCREVIKGETFEYIYRAFYKSKDELPY